MKFPLVGPTYTADSLSVDCQRAVNLYPERDASGAGKAEWSYYGTPGLVSFCTLPTAPLRGLWAGEGRVFAAAGSKLYEVFSNGSYTDRGDIGNDGKPVQMYPNGNQLCIVSAGKVLVDNGTGPTQPNYDTITARVDTAGPSVTWTAGDKFGADMVGLSITIEGSTYTVTAVADDKHLTVSGNVTVGGNSGPLLGLTLSATIPVTASYGAFLDGYFIAVKPSSKQINISALRDGNIWDAADYAFKEGYPDNIAAVIADHEELWLLGTQTTEMWRNTGNADFPLERVPGAFLPLGCFAPHSVCRLGNGIAWLAGDARGFAGAWITRGSTPERVSNHAIEAAWRKYSTVADAEAWVYEENGHTFWVITFATANATWVYDLATGMWHERAYGASLDRHRGRCHAYVWGKHLVGDHTTGAIYQMSLDTYTDTGTAITRLRTCPHISNDEKRVCYHRLQLDVEVGVGSSPAYTLSISNNGARTWLTGMTRSAGAAGEFGSRVIWNRLGSARDRVFRVTSTAAIRHAWVGAYLESSLGKH